MSDASPGKRFVVHDADGTIIKKGTCRPRDLVLQGGPGLTVVEVDNLRAIDDRFYKMVGSEVAEKYTRAQVDNLAVVERAQRQAERTRIDDIRNLITFVEDTSLREILTHLFEEQHGTTN